MLKLLLVVVGVYAFLVMTAYFLQTWLIFPGSISSGGTYLPANAEETVLETPDGEQITLVRIAPKQVPSSPKSRLFGFGGNAWNAEAVAMLLHQIFPEHEVLAAHYRGYGPSSGTPSAKALFGDARLVYDHLKEQDEAGIVAIGFSIGTAVAVDLAASRRLEGLVLVTPLDSLKELAATHYPWLPIRLLLRHKMETATTLAGLEIPVGIITAVHDSVIPGKRSEPVRNAAKDLRFDHVMDGVGHNDIYDDARFPTVLRESLESVVAE